MGSPTAPLNLTLTQVAIYWNGEPNVNIRFGIEWHLKAMFNVTHI